MAAALILGETIDQVTLGFALGVVATVFIGKRFSSPPQVAARDNQDKSKK
jgi:hypothetical protein